MVEGLRVFYGRIAALRDVSLRVDEGEIVGIIGPNGAGKSTTLFAVCGVVPVTTGTIAFRGASLVGRRAEDIVRQGIALVPEGRHIFGSLSVLENLKLGAAPRRDHGAVREDLDHMLERFPFLKANLRRNAGTLSGGEQQQLAIARTLMSRPRLLLLDEPSLGLAPVMVDRVFALVESLRRSGTTVLVVEQLVQRTLEIADRVYVMGKGMIVAEGPPEELGMTASSFLGAG